MRVTEVALVLDMGGPLWQVHHLFIICMPMHEQFQLRMQGDDVRWLFQRLSGVGPNERLPLPAMLTQLLAALASSQDVREYLQKRTVIALGWNDIQGFKDYPAISFKGTPRIFIAEDPLPPDSLFAFATS